MMPDIEGLLWQADNPKDPLAATIAAAAARYARKFGHPPDAAYVNAGQFEAAGPLAVAGLEVRPVRNVQRNCIWVTKESSSGAI